jgi:hypothetical protein
LGVYEYHMEKGLIMNHGEYLLKEYELCFEQLRFYDTRHSTVLTYLFSLTSAVATAQFAVFQYFKGPTNEFFACQAFLSIVVFVATVLLFLTMLQNRLYFVYIARQLNAIRGYLMETEAVGFTNNQLYTSTDFPALKPSSVHTFQILGAALLSALFAALSAYASCQTFNCDLSIFIAVIVGLIVAGIEIGGGIEYLSRTGKKTADDAIH